MKNYCLSLLAMLLPVFLSAQTKTADTVIVDLAKTSRIVFTMEDSSDLEELREYDFQAMFDDIIDHLESGEKIESREQRVESDEHSDSSEDMEDEDDNEWDDEDEGEDDDDEDEGWWSHGHWGSHKHEHSRHFVNFDLGTNNYLLDSGFPDEENAIYSVRPWGSWNIAINSVLRTRMSDHFYVDWGAGVSWYNFKFLNERTVVAKDSIGVFFYEDERNLDFVKSKLSITYLNASIMPTVTLGPERHRHRFWNCQHHDVRIGLGGYVGYRIESHYKQVHQEDGEHINEKDRDNFYLNNLRYGVRLQLGIHATDFYINYDLNELFTEGKGPELHPVSFGIVF